MLLSSTTSRVSWAGNMRKHACLETIEGIIAGKGGLFNIKGRCYTMSHKYGDSPLSFA